MKNRIISPQPLNADLAARQFFDGLAQGGQITMPLEKMF
jgi:hypothetical protein